MKLHRYRRIVVLTGAGISQAAGLPTYRGPGGVWNDPRLAELSDVSAFETRRREVVVMFWSFRNTIAKVEPTIAHRALAAFEARLPTTAKLTVITQNIDGLHQRAGSRNVCEFHGSLERWRCEQCGVELVPPREGPPPVHCGELMRPAVVAFGEMIPVDAEHTAKWALRECDLFVAIGTSGTVAPASSFVRWAELNQAPRILVSREIFEGARDLFTECHQGTADDLVPRLFPS
ncbi:MAG: Sir2 family NAD-dependent protein deacetylase [Kofleriaceae bacterium]|nr:Sir2 family NAD-dependent protein deacetylase [Kofleriaceae bacterium]